MHEDNCAVYVHVNLINGKKYFGITTREPEKRWQNGYGYYNNAHFKNAILKYGWENFAHFVLYRDIPIKIAKNIEEMLIQEHFSYDPRFGYNKTMGGELEIPTEEARQKMSNAHKGKTLSEEQRQKMSEAIKGYYKNNPEAREARSKRAKGENNPMYGKHYNEDERATMREAHLDQMKPVEAIDQETGDCVFYFESMMDAERAGFNRGGIWGCCNGKRKKYKGFIWRYIEEVNNNDGNNRRFPAKTGKA